MTEGSEEESEWGQLIKHTDRNNISTYACNWRSGKEEDAPEASTLDGTFGMFNDALQQSRLTGELLACTLAARIPFFTQRISLLGHCLGTSVISSCLEVLYELGVSDLIENVTLIAGATGCYDSDEE